jgi:hypothetical protein
MTKIYVSDAATGIEELRDMTAEEETHINQLQNDYLLYKAAEEKAKADKAALLAKLGITADEAALLLG